MQIRKGWNNAFAVAILLFCFLILAVVPAGASPKGAGL